jgi:hypothetical protein
VLPELVGVEQLSDDLRLDELGRVAAALALLRGRARHLAVGRHLAAVHDRPPVDPVDRVEQRRPLGEAGLEVVERVRLVDRVVDGPPLATLVMKTELWPVPIQRLPFMVRNGVPPTRVEEGVALLVDERAVAGSSSGRRRRCSRAARRCSSSSRTRTGSRSRPL